MGSSFPLPDWRDDAAYPFAVLSRTGFAWEWLRRSPDYRAAWCQTQRTGDASKAQIIARNWGLVRLENPDLACPDARPIHRRTCDPSVLVALAGKSADNRGDPLTLAPLGQLVTVQRDGDGEHILLSDGLRHLRIDVLTGTLLDAPTCVTWQFSGLMELLPQLRALHRLRSLMRRRAFASGQWPREGRAGRWTLALRAHDALASGASHRDIAEVFFGARENMAAWRIEEPTRRLQAQRLAKLGRTLVGLAFARRHLFVGNCEWGGIPSRD